MQCFVLKAMRSGTDALRGNSMKILGLLVLGTVTATYAVANPAKFNGPDAAAIKQARLEQNAAIVAHDLAAIASYWTDDVTICRGLGTQVAGKTEYLKLFEADDPKSKDVIVYERIPIDINTSSLWPLAFETGVWKGHAGSANGQVVIQGRYSAQWVKRADRWLIRSEIFVALRGYGPGLQLKAAP
jgi:ketosteroid isomerase-like protein